MYVGYTNSFSVRFSVLLNSYVCRWSKIFWMWIFCLHVLTLGTMTKPQPSWIGEGGTPSNCGQGPDSTACLVGLRFHLQLHWGRCLTRTGPKYVGSSVCTESLCMFVGYTNSFSIRFFVNTYDTVHIVLMKIHIVFTIAYNTHWACGGFFFSEIHSLLSAPLGARAYPWILSKYFPSVHPCMRPPVPLQISIGCVYCV